MKKGLSLLLLCLIAFMGMMVLSGCGQKEPERVVKVYNCGDYIDMDLLKEFEEKTGIKVIYDTYATNEDMYVKLKAGGSDYDVAVPSDYMITKMIREDMLEKIDFGNIPNYKNIDSQFHKPAYDPTNEFSVPYMWGTVGIVYNKKLVKEPVESWSILWDPKYAKQILMLDSVRDSIGVALVYEGFSLNTTKDEELAKAKAKLLEQKPLVLAYVVDEVKDKMIGEEAALAVVWSGDAAYIMEENEDIGYAIPKEGTNIWTDAMVIPKGAKNKKEAEEFINFMCSPEAGLKNVEYIGYASPMSVVKEQLSPEVQNDLAHYPGKEFLHNTEVFIDLGPDTAKYDKLWTEVKAAQ